MYAYTEKNYYFKFNFQTKCIYMTCTITVGMKIKMNSWMWSSKYKMNGSKFAKN